MKKIFYPLLLLLATTFTACSDDELTIPELSFETPELSDNGVFSVAQEDTLTLKVKALNTDLCLFHWMLDGEMVKDGPEYRFVSSELGEHTVSLKATNVDGGVAVREFKVNVYGKYLEGTFVLSEGNFSSGNGKLTFISPKGLVTDSAYFKANGSYLGHSTQDLCIADGKIYIVSQDNQLGGDGILVVADAATLKKEAGYTAELASLSNPTHVVVEGRKAYIRDNKGIHLFDLDDSTVKLVEGTRGAAKNRMALVDHKVYAMAGKRLLTLEEGNVVSSQEMDGNISGIVTGKNGILWIALDSKPAKVVKLDGNKGTVLATNTLDAQYGLNAGWGATPSISAKGDTIYFSNNGTTIYRHLFSQNQTSVMVDVKEHVANAAMLYNNLAVHPETGDVYFTTIKGYGTDYLINDISVFNFEKNPYLQADYKNFTAFPAGIFFPASFR